MDYFTVPIDIPFYSQGVDFSDANLQGFKSIEDAEYWQERGCGIASLKMIIDGFRKQKAMPLSEQYGNMIYMGKEMGAHCERGWIHAGLVKIANKYDISGKTFRNANLTEIQNQIEQDRPCIVSVTVAFKGGLLDSNGNKIPKGGHLIVVLGIVKENGTLKGFIVNHPSFYTDYNWERRFIGINEFENSFSGAFMSFWSE